jgi:hypothetical protein
LAPRLLLLTLLTLPLLASTPALAKKHHTVRRGETLWGIGRRHACSAERILEANRGTLRSARALRPGQVLTIPDCGEGGTGPCLWRNADIQTGSLKRLMRAYGFKAPQSFRALVVRFTLSEDGRRVIDRRAYDYGGASDEVGGWNPASAIKLYSAVSALERADDLGFGPGAQVTFHYKGGARSFSLRELIQETMRDSKNIPHNRLVQLAGFDHLNGDEGTLKRVGLEHSYIMRAYEASKWTAEGHARSLARSPRITLKERGRKKSLKAQKGASGYPCHGAACTSLSDLARMMCVMMLHEQLPPSQRLRLGGDGQGPHLRLLRRAMDERRKRGKVDHVWDVLAKALPKEDGYRFFRKAGFSQGWLSDNLYIYNPYRRTRWIVTMAGSPGRTALSSAARAIARVIVTDELK